MATTVRRNQHLLIHREPTLHLGPCLVFLDPAKKGLRYPNLKSKTSLQSQLKLTVTVSHQHHLSLQSDLLLNVIGLLITSIHFPTQSTAANHLSVQLLIVINLSNPLFKYVLTRISSNHCQNITVY